MAVSTKAFSKFASDSPVDFGSEFSENPSRNRAKIGLECSCRPKSPSKAIWGTIWPRFYSLGGASGCSGVSVGDPGSSLGRPWGAQGAALGRLGASLGVLGALQEPLGTPQGHLEPPGDGLGGFLLQKHSKMVTVVGFNNAASSKPTTVVTFPAKVTTVEGFEDAASYNRRHFLQKSGDSCRF